MKLFTNFAEAFSISSIIIVFALALLSLYFASVWLVRLVLRLKRSPRYHYKLLPSAALATHSAGWAFYFAGYVIADEDGSLFSVIIRSLMESIGMFFGSYSTGDIGWMSTGGRKLTDEEKNLLME